MSFPVFDFIHSEVSEGLKAFVSHEDINNGFREALVRDSTGRDHLVRITSINADLAREVVMRYIATGNPHDMIRPFVSVEQGTDTFLNALTPASLILLANISLGLVIGPEGLSELILEQIANL